MKYPIPVKSKEEWAKEGCDAQVTELMSLYAQVINDAYDKGLSGRKYNLVTLEEHEQLATLEGLPPLFGKVRELFICLLIDRDKAYEQGKLDYQTGMREAI